MSCESGSAWTPRSTSTIGAVALSTYLCTLTAGEPQATEHSELRWLTPAELDQVEWAPADIPTIRHLQECRH